MLRIKFIYKETSYNDHPHVAITHRNFKRILNKRRLNRKYKLKLILEHPTWSFQFLIK